MHHCDGDTLAGCAGLGAVTPPPGYGALPRDSNLVGTWTGTRNRVSPSLYDDEAILHLRIRQDGTFTATVTPYGAGNNLAEKATLAGTVVANDERVTLRTRSSPGPGSRSSAGAILCTG